MNILLQTRRLYLREFTEEDSMFILQLNSLEAVLKFLHEPVLKTAEDAKRVLAEKILPQYKMKLGRWAVFTNDEETFIGWCGLKYRAELNETDLGYRLLPEHWGKGYATEAARACLQYGFNTLRLKEIIGRAHIHNLASIRVLHNIGMEYIKDEWIDNCPVKTFKATSELSSRH